MSYYEDFKEQNVSENEEIANRRSRHNSKKSKTGSSKLRRSEKSAIAAAQREAAEKEAAQRAASERASLSAAGAGAAAMTLDGDADIELPGEGRSKKGSKKNGKNGNKKNGKKKISKKKVFLIILCLILAIGLAGVAYVASIILKAPDIKTNDIYSLLSQSSIIYDDQGNVIDTAHGDQDRTIVEISEIPEYTQNAFIALEDKTFNTHHGFNIIRIFGAIKDAVFGGGSVSGTSTITQQLARNLYLGDKMFERSMNRKIVEAYYAVLLEKRLEKPQILEAYLNTIYFGCGYGIQTAAQAYFSKDVGDLTIAESAALAAIPQRPSDFSLIKTVGVEEITEDTPNLITKSNGVAYLWNDACRNRMLACLSLMHEQGYITDEEYEEARQVEIKDIVNPNLDALNTVSNYFADFAIQEVTRDLVEQAGYSEEKAQQMVYNGGLQIYTTMDSQAQAVIDKEFAVDSNYPAITSYNKDGNGNIVDTNGSVVLYAYSNYINSEGKFVLSDKEYKKNEDGSLTIYAGKRLNIYDTTVQGQTDYSIEFKSMYLIDEGTFYTINGGYLNIPQPYKSRDKDNNVVLSADFFKDYPTFFEEADGKLSTDQYSLNQKVIEPQSAMVIIDNATGQIKAMSGGRKTTGRMLFNRATSPRQPGSSIKPLAVYSAALQKSYELAEQDQLFPFTDGGIDTQGDQLWGNYLTAASIIDDEPTTINGKVWPKNSYSGYAGLMTFRRALQRSVNVCSVKILYQVGVDFSADLLEKYGITSLQRENGADLNLAALGLGGMASGISPLEMASAYSTFVNDGVHKSYSAYTKVTTRTGDILLEPNHTETKVLDKGVAWIMRDVLRSVVTEGIGSPAAISGTPVGGKTGTTDSMVDIWFCGFTPKYSAALWIGNDVHTRLSSDSYMAAKLWSKIMGQVTNAQGGSYSEKPSNVVSVKIDTTSGLIATKESGKNVRTEYFTKGTEPTEEGSLYQKVEICKESGFLATPSCPETETKSGIMRPYDSNKKTGDNKKELPHYYCNLHNPDPKEYPVEEGLKVTIVPIPSEEPEEPAVPETPAEPVTPTEPATPTEPTTPTTPTTPDDQTAQTTPGDQTGNGQTGSGQTGNGQTGNGQTASGQSDSNKAPAQGTTG